MSSRWLLVIAIAAVLAAAALELAIQRLGEMRGGSLGWVVVPAVILVVAWPLAARAQEPERLQHHERAQGTSAADAWIHVGTPVALRRPGDSPMG